ncbi:hypothetical protein Aca07nite_76470 [Actinoplanes capillaceus]|uniref:DUF732 domain-containing protein n=1 Tax=Actinoplanes campanulatus TaxID=113559 RepID=A0ABQ3WVX9_9ACTN|nr:hypothetical protein [Actinoplanes capillaceus]GID50372.1 hypothetical protein Aca07nite_76470 [Actinoplanes capillaceus]
MTTVDSAPRVARISTYLILGITFLVLAGIGLATFRTAKSSHEARRKADRLVATLGLPAAANERIAQVLGDDGGIVCAAPNDELARSQLLATLSNGAGGPGARPVIADDQALDGMRAIVQVYCPDEADEFEQFVADLKLADTAK